LIDLQFTRK